jgi:hypothetical protein
MAVAKGMKSPNMLLTIDQVDRRRMKGADTIRQNAATLRLKILNAEYTIRIAAMT